MHETRTYADGLYQKTMATTAMLETLAYRSLAAKIDTAYAGNRLAVDVPNSRLSNGMGAGVGFLSANGALAQSEQSAGSGARPFVVFNPVAWERSEVIETTIWDNTPAGSLLTPLKERAFSVRMPGGKALAAQKIDAGNYWGHQFVRLALPLEVGPLGYATFTVCEETAPAVTPGVWQLGERQPQPRTYAERPMEGLENELVRVELDMAGGGIRSLLDKRSGALLISPEHPAPVLEYAVERPNGMTAWVIDNTGPAEHGRVLSIKRKLSGAYKASIEVKLQIHESQVTLTYELRSGDPQLYLHVQTAWFQRGTPETGVPVLRMALPLALAQAHARYEIPFGAVERDLNAGQEVPALQWAQVTGQAGEKQAGCLLINDSKYGYSLDGSTLRMTLIRSSYEPDILPEVRMHEIHAAVRPVDGDLPVAEAVRLGRDLNHALRVVGTDVHAGAWQGAASFIHTSPGTVVLGSVKKAEGEDALILTFFDPTGQACTAVASFDAALLGRPASAAPVDLMERPAEGPAVAVADGTVTVAVPAHGIASVKVVLAK